MLKLGKTLVAGVAAVVLVALVNAAPAANAVMPEGSSAATSAAVQKILSKAPETLPPGTRLKLSSTVVAATSLPRADKNIGEVTPLVASVSADDHKHSLVAESEDRQSLLTLLDKGSSVATFTMTIPEGFAAELDVDGGIQLKNTEENIVVPFIAKPWARDANGKSLPTSYSLTGTLITQQVSTYGAEFPIVADPSIQWIPFPVIAMWGWQADTVRNVIASFLVAAATVGCAAAVSMRVPHPVISVFASICSFLGGGSLMGLFGDLRNIMNRQDYSPNVCYGFPLLSWPGASVRVMPARDCQ